MQPPNRIDLYEQRLSSLRERLVTTLGIHTVRVLLARAIWQSAQRHPELTLIHLDDADCTCDAVAQSSATRPQEEIEAAFHDLCTEVLRLLARLLGREMAQGLAEELAVGDVPELDSGVHPATVVNALGSERTDEPSTASCLAHGPL